MKKEKSYITAFCVFLMGNSYDRLVKKFGPNKELEELLQTSKIEYPTAKVRNGNFILGKMLKLVKYQGPDEINILTKDLLTEYDCDPKVQKIAETLEEVYDLSQVPKENITDIKKEAKFAITGKF